VVDPQEDERRARMKRLREENDAEEERITALEQASVAQSQMGNSSDPKQSIVAVNLEELEELDEDEQMQRLLGFTGGFGSTKGTKVDDNHNSSATGAAQKNKARKYRQYMNRKVRLPYLCSSMFY
jgi:U4/U6.U5 tri-snRNP-associated protein 3